jgi:hypothetical protein
VQACDDLWVFSKITPEKLFGILKSGALRKENYDTCIRVLYDAVKIIYYRQERLNKPQLKPSEIASALSLAYFYHSFIYRFHVTGQLAGNFGPCPEAKAVAYFRQSVVGTVTDVFGRKVAIENRGERSLYKEQVTGKHVIAPQNYEEVRGKRLPWIRHTIEKTRSVFRVEENVGGTFRRTYLYTAISSIPLIGKAPATAYFVVVVPEDGNKNLRFVTAYQVEKHNQFLSRIEPGVPYMGK